MRKFIIIAIPTVSLTLFICIMLSGTYLKKSFRNDDDVQQAIEIMIQGVNNEEWEALDDKVEELDQAWQNVIRRIQFSSERDEIEDLTTNIARLRGAIIAEDKANALLELKEADSHFKNIAR